MHDFGMTRFDARDILLKGKIMKLFEILTLDLKLFSLFKNIEKREEIFQPWK